MNKKGIEISMNAVVYILLAIAVFVSISIFMVTQGPKAEGGTKWQICRATVNTADLRISAGLPQTTIDCPTDFVKIEKGNSKPKFLGSKTVYEVNSKEELVGTIMNEVGGCWWKLGMGDKNPFGDMGDEDYRCVVCAEISVDESILEEGWGEISGEEVMNYVKTHDWMYAGKKLNYAEFLDNFAVNEKIKLGSERGLSIPYTLMFIETKESLKDEYIDAAFFFGTFLIPGGGIFKLGVMTFKAVKAAKAAEAGVEAAVAIGKAAKIWKATKAVKTMSKAAIQGTASEDFMAEFYGTVDFDDAPSVAIGGYQSREEAGIFGLETAGFEREATQSFGLWKSEDISKTKCAQLY